MVLPIFKAMLRSPTPDDFLEQELLPAVKLNAWNNSLTLTNEELGALSNDRNLYANVRFSSPLAKHPLFLGFQWTERQGVDKLPRITVGKSLHLVLTESEWSEASDVLNSVVKVTHPYSNTISKIMRIPLSAVAHWDVIPRPKDGKKIGAGNNYGTIHVAASPRLIDEINKYVTAHQGVFEYLTALNQYTGENRVNVGHFFSRLHLPEPANSGAKEFDEIAYLLSKRPDTRKLALRLGELARKSAKGMAYPPLAEVSSALSEHFGIEDGTVTRILARRIQDQWGRTSILSAVDLANRSLEPKPKPRR